MNATLPKPSNKIPLGCRIKDVSDWVIIDPKE